MYLIEPHIVKSLKNGSRLAFSQVYDMLSQGVYSVAANLTKDESLAEEIVQEVFVKLWTYRDKLSEDGDLWVFLYVISKRLSLNKLRSLNRARVAREKLAYFSEIQQRSPEEDLFYKELEQMADRAIADLPQKQRQVIELSRNEGLTHQQIAERLGISSNTVKNHISQALKQLKNKLGTLILLSSLSFISPFDIFLRND